MSRSELNPPRTASAESQENIDQIIAAYSRFIPEKTLTLLGKDTITDVALGDHLELTMSILFSDIRDFTALSEEMTPRENFAFINAYLEYINPVITEHGGIIDKYIGDAIMVLFPRSADDAVSSAINLLHQLSSYNQQFQTSGRAPIRIGIGINTGLMMLGIIGGKQHMESTVISDAVNLASRIESLTKNYKVPLLISEHTFLSLRNQADYDIRFIDRVRVKGKSHCQSVYEVFDTDIPALREGKHSIQYIFEEALAHYHLKEIRKAKQLLLECRQQVPDDTVVKVYLERCDKFLTTGIHESSGEFDLTIDWSESIAIGHPEIDAQHRELFEHAGKFVKAIANSWDYSELQPLLEFLEKYVAEHFDTEERLMAEKNYPFLQMQIAQHAEFYKLFEDFKDELERDFKKRRIFFLFRTQVLLIDWLINHTSKLDRHFGKFLKQSA